MKIVHRIGLNSTPEVRKEIAIIGRQFIGKGNSVASNFVVFEIAESDPEWPVVRDWIHERFNGDVLKTTHTTFDEDELSEAKYLSMVPVFVQGYPQPERDFGYMALTYSGEACTACGAGSRQVAPFRFKGEPKWGRNGVMQLNWVYDEYFVTPQVFENVFRPLGVETCPVTDRKGRALDTVLQLLLSERVGIELSRLAIAQRCSACGSTKFEGINRGFVPPLRDVPMQHGAKSAQVFGDGGIAYRQVIVSQSVRKGLREYGVRGVSFIPVAQ